MIMKLQNNVVRDICCFTLAVFGVAKVLWPSEDNAFLIGFLQVVEQVFKDRLLQFILEINRLLGKFIYVCLYQFFGQQLEFF